jgi:gamma-glutamylcyclotransferase (GGCT)/AIG2-like uncharacterized protein YtfP
MNLFVYGSLIVPEIITAVTGRDFASKKGGVLRGYAQFARRDRPEAALLPFPDMTTEGTVYCDMDDESLRRIDTFTGDSYHRVEVNIETYTGEWVEAEAHVIHLKARKLLTTKPWDEDEFRRKHLKDVVRIMQAQTG